MKMHICLVKASDGWITTWRQEQHEYIPKDYVQLTEYLEVEFPDLPAAVVVAKQLDQLQAMEDSINLKAAEAIAEVNRRRQELLALPHNDIELTCKVCGSKNIRGTNSLIASVAGSRELYCPDCTSSYCV